MKTIVLLLMAACMASAQTRDAEWIRQNEAAWNVVRKEYPSYARTRIGMDKLRKICAQYDEWAKVNDVVLYNNPNKPIYYLRMFAAQRAQEREEQAAAEREELARWHAEQAQARANAARRAEQKEILDQLRAIREGQEDRENREAFERIRRGE